MRIVLVLLIISPFVSFGQLNCTIRLIDDYSNEEITVGSNFRVRKAQIGFDSTQNRIRINKLKGNYFSISSPDYETHEKKVKRKDLKNDSVTIRLIPNDSICMMRYDEIWVQHQRKSDTVEVSSANEITRYVKSILNYLLANEGNCGNGLCSYSNTYAFLFYFEMNKGIYQFTEVEKTQPIDYQCLYLEDNLKNVDQLLPTFIIPSKVDSQDEKMRFRIVVSYY